MTVPEPRLMSGTDIANYCGITLATLSKWVAAGRLPGPLPGTRRWDRKAIDLALDKLSGIQSTVPAAEEECPLEKWMREDEALRRREEQRIEDEWEAKYEARKAAERKAWPPRAKP